MAFKKLSPETLRKHKGLSFVGITTVFFCLDGHGKILLAKRGENARDGNGNWDCGAGGLKQGHSVESNIRREMKEEYDAEPIDMQFVGYRDTFRKTPDGEPTHWLAMDFIVRVDPLQVKINEPDMVADIGWFELGDLPSPMHPECSEFITKYNKQINQKIRVTK